MAVELDNEVLVQVIDDLVSRGASLEPEPVRLQCKQRMEKAKVWRTVSLLLNNVIRALDF